MSDLENMRRVIGREGLLDSPLSAEDHNTLLAGHHEVSDREAVTDLQAYASALSGVTSQAETAAAGRAGEAILSSLGSWRPLSLVESKADVSIAASSCQQLLVPRPTMESSPETVRNNAGDVLKFSRATTPAGTLEVAAATGEYGGVRWPSSESFIFGLNRSRASVGGFLRIPAHAENAVLTVSAHLRVEDISTNGGVTRPGLSLLHTIKGNGDLPLRGTAIAWCDASLSLHGASGSIRRGLRFVSRWVNRDGANSTDLAPQGIMNLACTVALGPAESTLSYFVDVECSAFAEEATAQFLSAFSVFECRNKPIPELIGLYVAPARLRLESVTARLCELPILLQHS